MVAEPEGPEDLDVGVGELVEPVAPEQPAPPGDLAASGRVAAEISEVEGAGQGRRDVREHPPRHHGPPR